MTESFDLIIRNSTVVDDPIQPARGTHTVILNGVPVWAEGEPAGAPAGRVLRREPRP